MDTNIVSELRRTARADPNVLRWSATVPTRLTFLSSLTILELDVGVQRLSSRDPVSAKRLRDWVEQDIPLLVPRGVNERCLAPLVPDAQ